MLGEVFYKFLMMIKKIRPNVKLIISGNYSQLLPVNDRISPKTDYSNSPCSRKSLRLLLRLRPERALNEGVVRAAGRA